MNTTHGLDRLRRLAALGAALLGLSCGGGGDSAPQAAPADPAAAPPAEVTVLMMGNSHTALNALPQQLDALLRAGLGGRSVATMVAPGWMFLDERLVHEASMTLLRSRRWTVVVLQAQKYSSSGLYNYSTSGAEALVRAARGVGALPVLFPEWPRRGVAEADRIHELHTSIALREPACVAPIGQAWDLALQRHPALVLHAGDGNHSSMAGAYLAALVLYATVTGASPLGLPDLANGVDAVVQGQLRQVAADTMLSNPPRRYCPLDPPLAPTERPT